MANSSGIRKCILSIFIVYIVSTAVFMAWGTVSQPRIPGDDKAKCDNQVRQSLNLSNDESTTHQESRNNALTSMRILARPMAFLKNQGQSDQDVLYSMNSAGAAVQFRQSSVSHRLFQSNSSLIQCTSDEFESSAYIEMSLVDANPTPLVVGEDQKTFMTNIYRGNNAEKWHSGIPSYSCIYYKDVYSGIDWKYLITGSDLKHEFIVSPGSNPDMIRVSYDGVSKIWLDSNGNLIVDCGMVSIIENAPIAFQLTETGRTEIGAKFKIENDNAISFEIDDYNPDLTLIIDPRLTYSTFFGGDGKDETSKIRLDDDHNIYISMTTTSTDIETLKAIQGFNANEDILIAKFDPSGKELLFCTYFGGSGNDECGGMVLDDSGNVYFNGHTDSGDLPTEPDEVFDTSYGGSTDAFVTKLDSEGTLIFSTYLGNSDEDIAKCLCVDSSGNVIIVGETQSSIDFPLVNAFQSEHAGDRDAFITKLNTTATEIVYSTYYGGSSGDRAFSVDVDANNNVVLVGRTTSDDLVTLNAIQEEYGYERDGFIIKLNDTGQVEYSSYLGGNADDFCEAVAVDVNGNAYVTGATNSPDFPKTDSAYDTQHSGNRDAFILKISPDGELVYGTFIGGSSGDLGYAIAIGPYGDACIVGETISADLDQIGSLQDSIKNIGNVPDLLIAHIDERGGQLLLSTFFGDTLYDAGTGVVVDNTGKIYILGSTKSAGFQTTSDAFMAAKADDNGLFDAFMLIISRPDSIWIEIPETCINTVDSLPHIASDSQLQFSANGIYIGETPESLTDQVFWLSSDSSVATIDMNGLVAAITPGKSLITVRDGYVMDTVTLVVEPSIIPEAPFIDSIETTQDYEIRVTLPDMFPGRDSSDTVMLCYRAGGALQYDTSTMKSWIRDSYIGSIPKNMFTARGVEYYIYVVKNGIAVTMPPGNPPVEPFRVQVKLAEQDIGPLVMGDVYQLIGFSFDLDPDSNTPAAVFEDDLGIYNPWVWRCAQWNAYDNRYQEYTEMVEGSSTITKGRGYVMATRLHTRLDADGYSTIPDTTIGNICYGSLTLDYGWNLVASPFAFDISINECVCASMSDVDVIEWKTDGSGYQPTTIIKPHTGYWIWSESDDAVLYLPSTTTTGTPGNDLAPSSGSANDWQVDLKLSSEGIRDDFISFGAKPEARNKIDNYDFHKPPPLGQYLALSFLGTDEMNQATELACDFREPSDSGWRYDFIVRGNTGEPCTISIKESSAIPAEFWIILHDPETDRYYDLKQAHSLVLPRIPDEQGIQYSIFVAESRLLPVAEDAVVEMPRVHELSQNYPNPFNASTVIFFSLPFPDDVRIEIFNILGQKVSSLQNGYLPAGNHTVAWDGRDEFGARVGSGVYFYRMTAGEYRASRQMVLVY
ncbi:MAG: T9SS type A sorting domain-containing protein [FCB group bacterium]|nr:T9SS type A sorting domain-containing protein [FCB group bacterium]